VLDDAFREGSFRPIEDLFREEEVALAQYESAAALATERELMRKPEPRHRLH
jgi:hypothetical protein